MREARKRCKKTQEQVADELSVTQPLVAKWESGAAVPPPAMWRGCAAAYEVSTKLFIAAAIESAEQIAKQRAS